MHRFILKIPIWNGKICFSYYLISFLLISTALIAGIVTCFLGFKYLQTVLLLLLGCLSGACGIFVACELTTNSIIQMFLFVMFTFLGVCFFYFLSNILVFCLNALHIRQFLFKKRFVIAAIIGAVVVGATMYFCIYRSGVIAIGTFLFLGISGSWYGKKNAENSRGFCTYDDLYHLKTTKEGEEVECLMSAEEN